MIIEIMIEAAIRLAIERLDFRRTIRGDHDGMLVFTEEKPRAFTNSNDQNSSTGWVDHKVGIVFASRRASPEVSRILPEEESRTGEV